MNVELALNKFIENSIKHKIKEDDDVPYSEHQANLIIIFCFSIADKIKPKEFESFIIENKIKYKSVMEQSGEIQTLLTDLQILHFKLLYHIAYMNTFYPEISSRFNFSEDLSELLNNEDKIIKLYKEVKKISLN